MIERKEKKIKPKMSRRLARPVPKVARSCHIMPKPTINLQKLGTARANIGTTVRDS